MSWTKINPRAGGPGRIPPVTVSISDRGSGKRKLAIRIAQEFARKGGFSDSRSCRADVFSGDGPDFGRLKIEESRAGAFQVHAAKVWGPLSVLMAVQPGWPRELAPTPVAAEIVSGGGIAFRLPWAGAEAGADLVADGEASGGLPPCPPAEKGQADSLPPWIDNDSSDALVFSHAGREITLTPRAHAIASKLHEAIGKGFMPYDALMRAAGVGELEYLRNAVSALRSKVRPLGLEIEAVPKLGYVMKDGQRAPAAEAPGSETGEALPVLLLRKE